MSATNRSALSPTYHICLLGGLTVARVEDTAQRRLSLPTGNAQSLLAYLLLQRQTRRHREQLGELFWPEAPPDRLRRSLSDLLYRLRQALEVDLFVATADTIGIDPNLELEVDLWSFEEAIKEGSIAALERAVELYTGELLPEFYDDWILLPRVALHESYLSALQTLAEEAESRHAHGRALIYFRQLAQADPLREAGHRGLMRVLAGQGRAAEALAIYDDLVARLRHELDAAPSTASQRLARQLQTELDARHVTASPQAAPLVGRRKERADILDAVEKLNQARGRVLAVEGEAGMGKSRLLATIAESARWRQIQVISVRIPQHPLDDPFEIPRQILAELLAPPRSVQMEAHLPSEELGALAPLVPAWQRHADRLVELPPERNLARLYAAIRSLIAALADLAPHLLIIDDLHRAEPALWQMLDAIVPTLANRRFLLLLAYRRQDAQKGPAWSFLSRWERDGYLTAVALNPLSVEDVADLLPQHLRGDAARIQVLTGGNPFYVNEFLLDIEGGIEAPERTVAERARHLAPAAWTALEAAAAIGDPIPYRLWRNLVDRSDEVITNIGQQLTDLVLLQPTAGGYQFAHDLIQQTIYAQTPDARQRHLHGQIADLLSADASVSPGQWARHLERAGREHEAATQYRRAGSQALIQFAHAEAQMALAKSLALTPAKATPTDIETLLDLTHACEVTGDRTQQKETLDEALSLAEALGDPLLVTQVLVGLGNWAALTGEHEVAHDRLNRALELAQTHGFPEQELQVELILGDLLWRSGDLKLARRHLETALTLAQRLGDRKAEGRALDGIAWTMSQLEGDAEAVFAMYDQALAVRRDAGDRLGEARTLLNILSGYQNVGAWDRLYALADEAIAAQREVHYRLGEAIAHQSLGLAAYALGDYAAAEKEVTAAQSGFHEVGERLGVVITTDTLGLIAWRQAEQDRAEQDRAEQDRAEQDRAEQDRAEQDRAEHYFQTALALAAALDSSTFNAFVQQDFGLFTLATGRYDQSIDLLQRARENWLAGGERLNPLKCEAALGLALLKKDARGQAEDLAEKGWHAFTTEEIGGEEVQSWHWMLAQLQRALGADTRADALLDAAYKELLRQASALADPVMRSRFFTNVPDNAAIVAARDERAGIQRTQTVTLAGPSAPPGKTLAPEDKITLRWTIYAPEDDLFDDKSVRRRNVLARLIRQATAAGATPTDQDLADALGVTRRTILRDKKLLAAQGIDLSTRTAS
ncbi:AAA family ATPase [bacterium]|nr:AAA family ATPase [bacterium]